MRRNDNPVVVGQMATGDLGHFYVGVDSSNANAVKTWYLAEPYAHPNEKFRGAFYIELEKIVAKAEHEIRALSGDTLGHYIDATTTTPTRLKYLKTIEAIIKQRAAVGFEYRRIIQIQNGRTLTDEALIAHYKRIYQFKDGVREKGKMPLLTVSVRKLTPVTVTPFLIVDNRYLVIELDAFEKEGNYTYPTGILVFDDEHHSQLIQSFETIFENAYDQGGLIKKEEFGVPE
jgi:hypothetical protein